MSKKFCPKCGRETEKFFENLCEECFSKNISLYKKLPTKIFLKTCRMCGKIFLDKHSAETIEKVIDKFLSEILNKKEVESASYRISDGLVLLTIIEKIGGAVKTEEIRMKIFKKNIICKYCAMKSVKYYRSKLQLRAPENLLEKIFNELEHHLNAINKNDNLSFISSLEKVRGGYDILIGSKSAAMKIAKLFKIKYKANIKISRKLSGYIRGKKAYKDTILISIE
jgi:NMD protein affecting ribosome stability and mRNA decay